MRLLLDAVDLLAHEAFGEIENRRPDRVIREPIENAPGDVFDDVLAEARASEWSRRWREGYPLLCGEQRGKRVDERWRRWRESGTWRSRSRRRC